MSIWIGAIPRKDDYVWNISSEKIPHLTILYLDADVSGPEAARIAEYVEHAAKTSLCTFGLSVKKRGELGDENADVLFFEKEWEAKKVAEFRNYLLGDDNILKLYNSTQQYPEWTPHLTLGYPDTPAKPDERDYPGIHYVQFDKVAVWFGDFEGPEFELESRNYAEVSMSSVAELDDVIKTSGADKIKDLLQYGVKGMKWGVRKADASAAYRETSSAVKKELNTKKLDKADKKWEKDANNLRTYFKVYNAAAQRMNDTEIARINDKPEYKNADFREDSPLRQKYYQEYADTFSRELNRQSDALLGTNARGTKRLQWHQSVDRAFPTATIEDVAARHADETNVEVLVKFDERGHILSFKIAEPIMHDGEALAEEVLEHYGVKGMKWGVRRDRDDSPQSVSVTQKKPGTKATATGGKNQPLSDDAKRTAEQKQRAKASTTDALSNQELKQLVERMQLEANYARLAAPQKSAGQKFVEGLLLGFGKQKATQVINKKLEEQLEAALSRAK